MIKNKIKENADVMRMVNVIKEHFPEDKYSYREVVSLMERAKTRYHSYVEIKGERWKRFRDTDYMVSTYGNVRHTNSPQNNKHYNSDGYSYTYFNSKPHAIHRLVAEVWIPNPDKLRVVNHKNEIRSDNYVDNLEWLSHGDNLAHTMIHHNRYKSVYTYTSEGELVNRYNSARGCTKDGFSRESVYTCLRDETRQHKGLYFRNQEGYRLHGKYLW